MSDKVALCERSRRRCNKKENSISLNEVKKSKPPSMINNKDTEYLEYCPDYKIKEVEIKDRIYPIYQIVLNKILLQTDHFQNFKKNLLTCWVNCSIIHSTYQAEGLFKEKSHALEKEYEFL